MSGSVCKVILIGNVVRDPEVRRTANGDPIVNLRVATSERWRDKNSGERKERSEFHSVVIFNENIGKIAESYVKKGSKIHVEGTLQTRKWQDQQGNDKYTTEIVLQRFRGELTLLDGKRDGDDSASSDERSSGTAAEYRDKQVTGGGARYDDLDDDIQFLVA
jgi:single-strand DNA-binding protein